MVDPFTLYDPFTFSDEPSDADSPAFNTGVRCATIPFHLPMTSRPIAAFRRPTDRGGGIESATDEGKPKLTPTIHRRAPLARPVDGFLGHSVLHPKYLLENPSQVSASDPILLRLPNKVLYQRQQSGV